MSNFDGAALRAQLIEALDRQVAALARKHRSHTFYALAVFESYAEEEGPIHPPSAAMNSVEALREAHPGADPHDFWGARWNPGDWRWPELPLGPALARRYAAITKLAGSGSVAQWRRVYTRQDQAVTAAVVELARRARNGSGAFAALRRSADFVVFRHDPSDPGPALARKTIPRATFARLFPSVLEEERQRAEIGELPAPERARYLISRLGTFEPPVDSEQAVEALVALGVKAVPALIAALDDPEEGWQAAMTLARIGSPAAAAAIPALIAHASRECGAQMWSACALGHMGRVDELVELSRRPATQPAAVDGLKAARPASYRALDELLARNDAKLEALIAAALTPGSASFDKTPADFDAVARATTSPHPIIRADAASALSDSDLGERNRARAVPILVGLLTDESSEVRRLATLSLGFCRRHAKPALARIRAMKDDPVPEVRIAAENALAEIAGRR